MELLSTESTCRSTAFYVAVSLAAAGIGAAAACMHLLLLSVSLYVHSSLVFEL